jgi:hypothetical protein
MTSAFARCRLVALLATLLVPVAARPAVTEDEKTGPPPPSATATPAETPTPTSTPTPTPTSTAAPTPTPTTRPTLVEVQGRIAALDLVRHRLTVGTRDGEVELGLDRNTLVYGPGGAATVLALQVGSVVRAAHDADGTAYWIQVRPAPPRPTTPPAPGPAAPPESPPAPPADATPRGGGA